MNVVVRQSRRQSSCKGRRCGWRELARNLASTVDRRPGLVVGAGLLIGAAAGESLVAPLWSLASVPRQGEWLPIAGMALLLAAMITAMRLVLRAGYRRKVQLAAVSGAALLAGLAAVAIATAGLLRSPLRALALAALVDGNPRPSAVAADAWVTGVPSLADDVWFVRVAVVGLDGAACDERAEAVLPADLVNGSPPLPGTPLRLWCAPYLPLLQLNPYEYDARRGLARDDVATRLRVASIDSRPVGLAIACGRLIWHLPSRLAAWCAVRLQGEIDAMLTGDARALALAFLLGNRTALRQSPLQADFEASGGLHLAAVSGLHVGLVAAAVDALAAALRLTRTRRTTVVISIALLYALIAGGAPSVVRATAMVACTRLAPRRLRPDGLNTLAIAVIGLVLCNPLVAGDPGFQLSVLATFGILAAGQSHLATARGARWRRVRTTLVASANAQFATLPVVVANFCRLNPWAPFSNVILLPLGSACVTAAFAAGCLGLVHPLLLRMVAPALALALNCLAVTVRVLARLPWSTVATGHPGVPVCLAAMMLVACYLLSAWGGSAPRGLVVAAVALVLLVPPAIHRPVRGMEARYFAVGQGDCALVRSGRCGVLVDCGLPGATGTAGASAFARAVLPYLRATLCDVQLVVITHPHADHCGGLADVLRTYPGAQVIMRNCFVALTADVAGVDPTGRARLAGLDCPQRLVLPPAATATGQLEISVFWAENLPPGASGDHNEESLAMRFRLCVPGQATGLPPETSLIFAADGGFAAEESWQHRFPELLRGAVLKVGHHGSNGASSPDFLQCVSPRLCVVSVGTNRFGHPGPAAWQRLSDCCPLVMRTDRTGMVTVAVSMVGVVRFRCFRHLG